MEFKNVSFIVKPKSFLTDEINMQKFKDKKQKEES